MASGSWDDYTQPYRYEFDPSMYSLGVDPYLNVPDPVLAEPAAESGYDWKGFGGRLASGYAKQSGAAGEDDPGPGFPAGPRQQAPIQGQQRMDGLMAGLTGTRNPWAAYKPYGSIYGQTPDQQQILRILGLAR